MRKNIFIIEDDDTLRLGLELIMSDEGYEVRSAISWNEMGKVKDKFEPDLYLIDYKLPGIDGLEITKRIRSKATEKNVPIIIISASTSDIAQEVKKAGADGYLRKPFEVADLMGLIRKVS